MNQQFNEYIASLRGKDITVIGMGISNRPLIHMLCQAGAHVTARDKNGSLDTTEWTELGIDLHLGEDYLKDISGDFVYRTPGLRPDHPALEQAKALGSTITSEMEDFFALCPCPIYGITGSDGKTTTASLIAEMLRHTGKTVHLGGNIGAPLLTSTGGINPDDLCVVELSSFQLLDMAHSPDVAVITNISPNHLDWHRDMAEYIDAKKRILEFQKPGARAVLNQDNPITVNLSGPFETDYFGGDMIQDGVIQGILPVSDIKLRGWHNVENMMAAMAAVKGLADPETIRNVAATFSGVAHRDELIRTVHGISYYNDSIGSSPTRTIATLLSHTAPVHLIAGGRGKNVSFGPLAERLSEHVKCLYLIGAAAGQIEQAARKANPSLPIIHCQNLSNALKETKKRTVSGDTVLLSPACTSFDQYVNFEERGKHFRALVEAL